MEHDMITEFIAVRHGETDENLRGILQGQSDTRLNDRGVRQAQCAAERLKPDHFDFIFSSDLSRAMDTARKIAGYHQAPVRGLQALREWDLGRLQGGSWTDLADCFPEVMAAFKNEQSEVHVPGGESRSVFYQRVADCLDEMPERFSGKKILLVTHGGVLKAIFHHIVGPVSGSARLPLTSNASVSAFRYIDGLWQLVCWNDVSHLRSLGENESVVF